MRRIALFFLLMVAVPCLCIAGKPKHARYPALQHVRKVYVIGAKPGGGYPGKMARMMAKKLRKSHCIAVTNGSRQMPDALVVPQPYQGKADKALSGPSSPQDVICVPNGPALNCSDGFSVNCVGGTCVSTQYAPLPQVQSWHFVIVDPKSGKRISKWAATWWLWSNPAKSLEKAVGCH